MTVIESMMKRLAVIAGILLLLVFSSGMGQTLNKSQKAEVVGSGPLKPTLDPPTFQSTHGDRTVGYFVQWGIYDRNYHVKNVKTSGSADMLAVINYSQGELITALYDGLH
jgi:hypothetical protein